MHQPGGPRSPPAFPNPCSCWHRQLPTPCPAPSGGKQHRANPSPISPNPTPTPDHILWGTGMLPTHLPAQKPQIHPSHPTGLSPHHVPSAASPRCARGQAAATLLFCPEPPEQPADCGRRKQKNPNGELQRHHRARPHAPGLCHHRPQNLLPAAAPRRAGSGAGTTGTALPPHRVPLGRHLKGRRVLGMAPLAPHGHSRAAPCPRSVAGPELVSGSVLAEEPQSHLLRLGDAQPKPGRSRGWHSLCFQPVSMVNTLCTANVTIFLG